MSDPGNSRSGQLPAPCTSAAGQIRTGGVEEHLAHEPLRALTRQRSGSHSGRNCVCDLPHGVFHPVKRLRGATAAAVAQARLASEMTDGVGMGVRRERR